MKNAIWENWVNLLAGMWVFLMPWTINRSYGEAAMDAPMWNLLIVGGVVFIVAALALKDIKPWEEWINLCAGLWLLFSPWIFSYTHETSLFLSSFFIGMLIAMLSGVSIPIAQRIQRRMEKT